MRSLQQCPVAPGQLPSGYAAEHCFVQQAFTTSSRRVYQTGIVIMNVCNVCVLCMSANVVLCAVFVCLFVSGCGVLCEGTYVKNAG